LNELGDIAGEHVRENRSAFDQAGISETGLLPGSLVFIDQDDVAPPLLQVQGGGYADHARSQHKNIGLQFRHPALPSMPPVL